MTLSQTLFARVKASLGAETLIFADQNSPRPGLPYWTIKLAARRAIGRDSIATGVNAGGEGAVRGVREVTVQLQRLGADSHSVMYDFHDSLHLNAVQELWWTDNLALFDIGEVNNIPYRLDNSQLEPRAALDLFVRYGTELIDDVGIIEQVDIDAGYVSSQEIDLVTNIDLSDIVSVVL